MIQSSTPKCIMCVPGKKWGNPLRERNLPEEERSLKVRIRIFAILSLNYNEMNAWLIFVPLLSFVIIWIHSLSEKVHAFRSTHVQCSMPTTAVFGEEIPWLRISPYHDFRTVGSTIKNTPHSTSYRTVQAPNTVYRRCKLMRDNVPYYHFPNANFKESSRNFPRPFPYYAADNKTCK